MKKAFVLLFSILSLMLSAHGQTKPNVVYIMADDLGWGDISLHGSDIPTPNIDSFFKGAVELKNFMSWCVCSPTRAGLLTGIHPMLTDQAPETDGEMTADMVTMAETFKSAGYATGAFGKWHNNQPQFRDAQGNTIPTPAGFSRSPGQFTVNDHGFDEWVGFYAGGANYLTKEANGCPQWFHNDLYVPLVWDTDPKYMDDKTGYATDLFADYAAKFIQASYQKGKPFFCYVPFSAVHDPLMYKNANRPDPRIPSSRTTENQRMYAEMLILLDDAVGVILNKLTALGISDNTIVVFTSDNGATPDGNNLPFRGNKHSVWDGGIHVPTAIRWKNGGLFGNGGSQKYDGLMGYLDMYPTLSAMCGVTMLTDPNRTLDGYNVWPALQSRTPTPVPFYMAVYRGMDILRTPTMKYVREKSVESLFNLTTDVGETTNVKSSNQATFNRLAQMAQDWLDRHNVYLTHVAPDPSKVGPPAPSGDVLKITLTKNAASLSSDFWMKFGKNAQLTRTGDYFEYDIYIPSTSASVKANITTAVPCLKTAALGSADLLSKYFGLDQEGNLYSNFQSSDYNNAHGRWGRYRVGLGTIVPRSSGRPHLVLDKNSPVGTYVIYVDNVKFEGEGDHDLIGWEKASDLSVSYKTESKVKVTTAVVNIKTLVTVVPDLKGQTQAAAKTSITNAGLVVGTITTNSSSTVAAGKLMSQSPAAGSSVNGGSKVNYTVSRGPSSSGVTITFTSVAAHDGYVDESSETSNVGGTNNAAFSNGEAIRVGDTGARRQRKGFVSFNTASIPDTAVITAVTLKLKRGGCLGTPTSLGSMTVDAKNTSSGFNGNVALETADFQAAASKSNVGTLSYPTANGNWATASLNADGLIKINKTGYTQYRIRFTTDDDNDTTGDYLGFYSGESATAANRPVLEVTYH